MNMALGANKYYIPDMDGIRLAFTLSFFFFKEREGDRGLVIV